MLTGYLTDRIEASQSMSEIRVAARAGIPAVAELVVLHSGGERITWAARLEQDLVDLDRCLLVAEEDDAVVGYGRAHRFQAPGGAPANIAPEGYYLSGLVVALAHRGCGIGGAITDARLAWIAGLAAEAWYLTNARNERSLRLHERFGFREVTRDFVFPGVSFEGGVGVLSCVKLQATRGG